MIETLISSKTRVKLLLKFFLNSNNRSYLRNLETEFSESTNAIRIELNKFEKVGMLFSEYEGNKKIYRANTKHTLFPDIQSIVRKYTGIDSIIEYVVKELGDLKSVHLTGSYANGLESDTIELIFTGNINEKFLTEICRKLEKKVNRKIVYKITKNQASFDELFKDSDNNFLELWKR